MICQGEIIHASSKLMSRVIRIFHYGPLKERGDELDIDSTESHHLSKVLRRTVGDPIEIINGQGARADAECIRINDRKVTVRILGVRQQIKEKPSLRMVLAMTKGGRWEALVKPLTELGVDRITPIYTDRTQIREGGEGFVKKIKKYERLAVEACKQSGNPWLPQIDQPLHLADYLSGSSKSILVASLAQNKSPLQIDMKLSSVDIMIGPEGGWTEIEEHFLRESGAKFFTLGKHTLRTETAALTALAVARSHFLD